MIAVAAVVHALHIGFNVTDSMPIGFYRLAPLDRPVRAGDIVELSLPADVARFGMARGYLDRGTCPTGAASAKFGPGQFALRRALGAYNTGSIYDGTAYVDRILAAAGIAAGDDFRVPDLAAMPGMRTAPLGPVRLLPARLTATPKPRPVAVATPQPAPTPDARLPFVSPILVEVNRPTPAPVAQATPGPAGSAAPSATPAPSNAGARISSLIVDGVGLTHAALSPRSSPVILLIATPPPVTPVSTPQPAATAAP